MVGVDLRWAEVAFELLSRRERADSGVDFSSGESGDRGRGYFDNRILRETSSRATPNIFSR